MDYTELFNAVIKLVAVLLTMYVIPSLRDFLMEKNLLNKVEAAVKAAEQVAPALGLDSAAKLDYAFEHLRKRGVNVDDEVLRAEIEAQVYELKEGIFGQVVSVEKDNISE